MEEHAGAGRTVITGQQAIALDGERIFPVEEMVAYEEFTDRVEILRELDEWVKNIQRMASPSTAIIAPRRMGKTVLLDRLVNTVFFKPEYKVAPFYFRMKREDSTLKEFLLFYAKTFFRQYIAYCHQDALLYGNESIALEMLLELPSSHKAVIMAKQFIEEFLAMYYDERQKDTRNQWDAFIHVPERLASYSGTRVAVIIDEFQDMKFYVHNLSEESVKQIKLQRQSEPALEGVNLTATYDRQSQSKKAPMLVSGSAVTLIFKTVMGGVLSGRFDFMYLRQLSIPDGAALLRQLLATYLPGSHITPEDALYVSAKVGGHPYYLYCAAMSKCPGKDFSSQEHLDRIIRYEIEQGKIYGFWQTHFDRNRAYINADNDEALGKKIIYAFTKYYDRPVDIKEMAAQLHAPKKEVEEKMEKLYLADLVYRSAAKFYTFNDICLMRYIQFVYAQDVEGVETIDLSQQGLFNTLKGKFLELVVQVTMMKFDHETLEGAWFGRPGRIEVPRFQYVAQTYTGASKTRQYQLDVYGAVPRHDLCWICECKYTKTKMGMPQVRKLEAAAEVMREEYRESGRTVPQIQLWLVSTGGFTGEVLEYVKDREDIYYSDHDGINQIFMAYGGNYRIPVFHET